MNLNDNVRDIDSKAMHDKHLCSILEMLAHTNPKAALAILGNSIEAVFVFIKEVDEMPEREVKKLLGSFLFVLSKQVNEALNEEGSRWDEEENR